MWKGLVQSAVAIVAFALGWILRSASTESQTAGLSLLHAVRPLAATTTATRVESRRAE